MQYPEGIWEPVFSEIGPPWWDDAPAIIVGTGPSMRGFDHSRLRGLGHVLAVKQSWMDLPFAEAVCGLDLPWMGWARDDLVRIAAEKPLYLCVPDQRLRHEPVPGAIYLRRSRVSDRLSTSLSWIEGGGNSGFVSLNLAFLKRARTIYLFGYDYCGIHHRPDQYAARNRPVHANDRYLPGWAGEYRDAAIQLRQHSVDVVCASTISIVDAFPRVSHEQALHDLDRLRSARDGCIPGDERVCTS